MPRAWDVPQMETVRADSFDIDAPSLGIMDALQAVGTPIVHAVARSVGHARTPGE